MKRSKSFTCFYLSIIDSIKKSGKLPNHKDLNISKQRLNYYVKHLKLDGIIKKLGYGTWALINEKAYNEKYIFKLKEVKKMTPCGSKRHPLRSHAFVFTTKIQNIYNWNNRTKYLDKKKIKYEPIPQGQRIILNYKNRDYKIWLCNKSIVIYFPKGLSYYSDKANKGVLRAIYDYKCIIGRLENVLNMNIKISNRYLFKVSRQHHSLVENELAKQYRIDKQKLYVSDKDGLWLIMDYSFNVDELDLVSSKSNKDADEVIVPLFNDIKEKPHYLPSQVKATLDVTLKLVQELAQAQMNQTKLMGALIPKPKKEVKEDKSLANYFG